MIRIRNTALLGRVPTTKNLSIQSTTVYVPSSELGLSHPLSRQRVCPSPRNQGGRGVHTRLRVRGWESPNSDDWKKSLALCAANPAIRNVLNQITLPSNCLITEILAVL